MKRSITLAIAICLAAGVAGCSGDNAGAPPVAAAPIAAATFDVTDEAGHWFDTGTAVGPTRSLAVVKPGDRVRFLQTKSQFGPGGKSRVESFHTVTSLIWPAGTTPAERIDQDKANKDDHDVVLRTPGLHVFVCKLHPYMLAGVIVDEAKTEGLDIGEKLHLLGVTHTEDVRKPATDGNAFPSLSNLGLRLLRTFFVVTSPTNWKDYSQPVGTPYKPDYPNVDVRVTGGAVANLKTTLQGSFDIGDTIPAAQLPTTDGIGEVWVDTQYEVSQTKGAAYPSTVTVVDVEGTDKWTVKRKIALPNEKMNNGHNMWASHDQNEIYQTEWHGKSLYVLNRVDGSLKQELVLGQDPAHVMTRVNNEQVHVGLNGGNSVVELNKAANGTLSFNRNILVQNPGDKQAQPHAHWMGHDGNSMVTPNSNTNDSTFWDFITDTIKSKPATGTLPIASGINPDSTKYYVSNYLGHSISVIDMATGNRIKDISLLQNYDPISGNVGGNGAIGGLPIQTPVSPDGKFVVTGNTLTGTITIIRTSDDTLVKSLACDPGCHGVNFGAKKGGGYYAYVTSKFANRLVVYDIDPDGNGDAADATLVGWILLADDAAPNDDPITANRGMGGQGLLPVPNVYNGWVQKLPSGEGPNSYCGQLVAAQRSPFAGTVITPCAP